MCEQRRGYTHALKSPLAEVFYSEECRVLVAYEYVRPSTPVEEVAMYGRSRW